MKNTKHKGESSMFIYKDGQREKFFDYLTETFNLSEKGKVISNKIIPFNKNEPLGPKIESLSIDIVSAIDDKGDTIISTNGFCSITNSELCLELPFEIDNNKTELVIERIYDFCSRVSQSLIDKKVGETLTVDFSDIIGCSASAEITNEVGMGTNCDGACDWLMSMFWIW